MWYTHYISLPFAPERATPVRRAMLIFKAELIIHPHTLPFPFSYTRAPQIPKY